jgi:dTMP kinase
MPLVALCGIDGTGKTTTCADLTTHPRLAGAQVVAKRDRRDVQLLRRTFPNAEGCEDALLDGPSATATRWAHALDFLRFYDEAVVPALREAELVVSDRWTPCSIAYADVGTALGGAIAATLAPCKPADLIIYLDVKPEEAVRRIRERGDTQADESLRILRMYRESYESWLPRMATEVVRVSVDGRTRSDVTGLVAATILDRFMAG